MRRIAPHNCSESTLPLGEKVQLTYPSSTGLFQGLPLPREGRIVKVTPKGVTMETTGGEIENPPQYRTFNFAKIIGDVVLPDLD